MDQLSTLEADAPAAAPTAPHTFALHATCAYAICTNPRSGSWLLSEGLDFTGLAGHPREWFLPFEEQQQRARWGRDCLDSSPRSYLSHIVSEGSTSNGVFGLKLHHYQLANLAATLRRVEEYRGMKVQEALAAAFPSLRYIWLTRKDKARQAISYQRAVQTEQWWQLDEGPPDAGGAQLPLDLDLIAGLEQVLLRNEASWQRFFARCGADPFVVSYEELSADYAGTIGALLDWLGIAEPGEIEIRPPRLRRQADSVTEAWLDRYRAFKQARPDRTKQGARPDGAAAIASAPQPDGSDEELPLAELRSPLFMQTYTPPGILPAAWRQWLAQALLQGVPRATVIETMASHGLDAGLVRAEIDEALQHPYLRAGLETRAHLLHGVHILGALDQLARLQPWARVVPRCSAPPRATFCEHYYAANRPVVLTGLMDDWAAMTRWTPDYLRSALGDEEVEIMADRQSDPAYEVNGGQHRRQIRFADYVDHVYDGTPSNDYYLVANNQFFQRPASEILLQDFTPFDEYLDAARLPGRCFLWFGPAGTVTPLHHDPCNILIAQVSGRKQIKLVPSTQWENIYTTDSHISEIDCERPDFVRWPRFCHATPVNVTISPGEVLFLPVGWSHHVRALEPSISISFTNFVFPNDYPR